MYWIAARGTEFVESKLKLLGACTAVGLSGKLSGLHFDLTEIVSTIQHFWPF
jgi:hypothetical protein